MDMNLNGKVAIITGAASGLGKSIAEELAKEGTNLVINYHSRQLEADELVNKITSEFGVSCIAVKGDLQNKNDLDILFDTAIEEYGDVDILINNAGIWPTAYVEEMEVDEFEKTLQVNLIAPFILSKKMVNYIKEKKKKGKIINIVSQAAFHGSSTGHAHYAASKAGLVKFTISMAREVSKYGINCNCIAPGMIYTPMVADAVGTIEKEEYYLSRIPIGRIAEANEVAYTAVFLASDKSDYITGATIDVTGGMLMR